MLKRRKNPSGVKRKVAGLGARLLELRLRAGLSQAVLAVRAGLSTPRIVDAERLDVATSDTLRRLATALGVNVDQLTGRTVVGGRELSAEEAKSVRAGALGTCGPSSGGRP